MILVDIYIPSVDKTYDFSLDETAKIQIVIEEIVEMIGQKEHTTITGDTSALWLCDSLTKRRLPRTSPLEDCGIHNGSSLLLV